MGDSTHIDAGSNQVSGFEPGPGDEAHPNHFRLPSRPVLKRGPRLGTPKAVRLELPLDDDDQLERDLTVLVDAVQRARDLCRNKALLAQPGALGVMVRKQLEGANHVLRRRLHLR